MPLPDNLNYEEIEYFELYEGSEPPAPPAPPVPPSLPATGDNTPVALWFTLLTASAVCLLLMAKRKHA